MYRRGECIRNPAAPAPHAPEAERPEVAPAAEEAPTPAPAAEPAAAPPPPPPPAARTYTVVSGDTLWAISERFYGDGSKYQLIADASGVSNPDLIYPAQVLPIPQFRNRVPSAPTCSDHPHSPTV